MKISFTEYLNFGTSNFEIVTLKINMLLQPWVI